MISFKVGTDRGGCDGSDRVQTHLPWNSGFMAPLKSTMIQDHLSRPLRDLRISVTDRCNFRCGYCMPKEVFGRNFAFLPHSQILTFEEITRLARIFVSLGTKKIRITGGEPLLRRDLEILVGQLAEIDGLEDLSLTTNGSLLSDKAHLLADAGLKRITVSLDSLDDEVFQSMNDVSFPVSRVLEGIAAAESAGLSPIKVNCVVRRGINERSIVELARRFHGTSHIVRFIEYMDVGGTIGWNLDEVVPAAQVVARIDRELPLEPIGSDYRGEVAKRYRYRDGGGEIGVISSVTAPFCSDCSRARLSSEGKLFTCLFAGTGRDLKTPLRNGRTDGEIADMLRSIWMARSDRYSEIRSEETTTLPRVAMSSIGG